MITNPRILTVGLATLGGLQFSLAMLDAYLGRRGSSLFEWIFGGVLVAVAWKVSGAKKL